MDISSARGHRASNGRFLTKLRQLTVYGMSVQSGGPGPLHVREAKKPGEKLMTSVQLIVIVPK